MLDLSKESVMNYPSTIDAAEALDVLPPSWLQLHQNFMERFHRSVGEDHRGWILVHLQDGLPVPAISGDKVLDGVARKAAQAMKMTCSGCGGRARQRTDQDRHWIQCARCFAVSKLQVELRALLEACPRKPEKPSTTTCGIWHEHELSTRVRAVIPKSLWRSTQPPGGPLVRYFLAADLARLQPWLRLFIEILGREPIATT